jgi:hypothetical protein
VNDPGTGSSRRRTARPVASLGVAVLVAVVLAGLTVAGCSGGRDDDDQLTPGSTRPPATTAVSGAAPDTAR